jgi:hypothetical protein
VIPRTTPVIISDQAGGLLAGFFSSSGSGLILAKS